MHYSPNCKILDVDGSNGDALHLPFPIPVSCAFSEHVVWNQAALLELA